MVVSTYMTISNQIKIKSLLLSRHHSTSGDFFKEKFSFPYNVKTLMVKYVLLTFYLLTKNALEHVHLEDEFVQNQIHIAGRRT